MKVRFVGATAAAVVALTAAVVAPALASTEPADDGAAGDPNLEATVTFWHAYSATSPEVETIDTVIIPGFNELYPNVKVESVAIPYDELHQKLVTAVAGGALPDVVRSDIIWVPELAELGVVAALDQEMPDFADVTAGMFPGTVATNYYQGNYYGLPLDTNTRVMMYNSDALEAAGMDAAPATFDELRALAEAQAGTDVYAFADNGASGWNVLPWIWSAGGSVTDDEVTTATGHINSPESVEGVQLLVDLFAEDQIPDTILGNAGGTSTSDGLATGMYTTILDGPWMYPIFAGQYPDFELQAALVPAGDGGSISVVGGESLVMTNNADTEATLAFMRYLVEPEAQLAMAEVGQMPVLSDVSEQLVEIQPYYATFVEQLATAKPRTPTPAWPQIDALLQAEIQKAIRGDVTVQEALDSAAAQIDELLAQYAG